MKNFKYIATTYAKNEELVLRTNDPCTAITYFFDDVEEGVQCDIVDGFTGEVLAIANNPNHDNYATAEMGLMMLGWLMEQEWGEPEVEEPQIKCLVCGLPQ